MHYDVISAFIKSIRGSDPDAAIYYLARMIDAGEDIKFIARRLLILASEDIGLADPMALVIANSTFSAIEKVGMPESRIILSQLTIYLSLSPKSNTSYMAINEAINDIKNSNQIYPVPLHLKSTGSDGNYLYPHNYLNGFVKQDYLPKEIKNRKYYNPKDIGEEYKLFKKHIRNIKGEE